MISHELKFIFIHIPKTSGNSLTLFLKDYIENRIVRNPITHSRYKDICVRCEINKGKSIKHAKINYYYELYGKKKIKNYYKFTIVRNPYDRILSNFLYKHRGKFKRHKFISYIDKHTTYQYKFVDKDCHIIHFENLIDGLKEIPCFKNVVDFDNYPRKNVNSGFKKSYDHYLDDKIKDMIYKKFKKDFRIFGYQK